MKILLNENLPQDFRLDLAGHDARTTAYMGWGGIGNGRLLALAAERAFDVVLTKDIGIAHQHNRTALPIAVLIIRAPSNSLEVLRPLVPAILAAIDSITPRTIAFVPADTT